MADTTYTHELEALIIDLTDGTLRSWWEIRDATGLSEERSKEVASFITEVFKKYNDRNKL